MMLWAKTPFLFPLYCGLKAYSGFRVCVTFGFWAWVRAQCFLSSNTQSGLGQGERHRGTFRQIEYVHFYVFDAF